jgi:hypothetical protein
MRCLQVCSFFETTDAGGWRRPPTGVRRRLRGVCHCFGSYKTWWDGRRLISTLIVELLQMWDISMWDISMWDITMWVIPMWGIPMWDIPMWDITMWDTPMTFLYYFKITSNTQLKYKFFPVFMNSLLYNGTWELEGRLHVYLQRQ